MPQTVAEDDDVGATRPTFLDSKVSPERRMHLQDGKQLRRGPGRGDPFGLTVPCQGRRALPPKQREVFEEWHAVLLPADKDRHRERHAANPVAGSMHDIDAVGIWERQRPEEDRADHREHGGVRTNAERQGEHGNRREPGTLPQHPHRVPKILEHGFDCGQTFELAVGFSEVRGITQLKPCLAGGDFEGHSATEVLVRQQFEMARQFLLELSVNLPKPEERPDSARHRAQSVEHAVTAASTAGSCRSRSRFSPSPRLRPPAAAVPFS